MDAFAVSISSGCGMQNPRSEHILVIALSFGLFQAIMPIIGWYTGSLFSHLILGFDHWIAFGLLAAIGVHMIYDAAQSPKDCPDPDENPKHLIHKPLRLLMLSVATSIDALAVGLSFSFAGYSIFPAVFLIGAITFFLSAVGVKAGSTLYVLLEDKVEIVGGLILIAIGTNILLQHTIL